MVRGFKVLEVLNKKKDRRRRHGEGKDDEIDADGTSIPKLRGRLDELRSLLVARKRCVSCALEIHAAALSLTRSGPRRDPQQLGGHIPGEDDGICPEDRRERCWPWCAWKGARDEVDAPEHLMRGVVEKHCPSLLAI